MNAVETWRMVMVGLLCFVVAVLHLPSVLTAGNTDYLQIHFLDVGQGDSVLIQTPDGYELLIDGGAGSGVLRQIAQQQSWWDRNIELVVATHADSDHVGGLVDVLAHYEVDMIVETEADGSSPADKAFAAAVVAENATHVFARTGQRIQLGASTTVDILSPRTSTENWRTNTASVVLKVTYGDTAVLLTGDAPTSIEKHLADAYGAFLESDILKLGHHGSKTSTSELFLDTVQPQYAVVSAAVGNRHGHPHQEVMGRVFARDITSFHTGIDGTVSFYSDGTNVQRAP